MAHSQPSVPSDRLGDCQCQGEHARGEEEKRLVLGMDQEAPRLGKALGVCDLAGRAHEQHEGKKKSRRPYRDHERRSDKAGEIRFRRHPVGNFEDQTTFFCDDRPARVALVRKKLSKSSRCVTAADYSGGAPIGDSQRAPGEMVREG